VCRPTYRSPPAPVFNHHGGHYGGYPTGGLTVRFRR